MPISTETCFDMLPHAVAIIERLDLQAVGNRLLAETRKAKPELPAEDLATDVGLAVIMHVARNLAKVKPEFFALLSAATGVDVETAKARPLTQNLQTLRDVFLDPELMGFFKAAVR